MSKGCFITGTDTGVGKTVVTATLAAALLSKGLRVGVMKPAETGCPQEGGSLLAQDALFLRAISACQAPIEVIVPYRFAEPITPALAAKIAGVTITVEHIRQCYQQLLAEHDIVLVEGAGGLLAPLSDHLTMHDLAISLDLPLLIVARNTLGVINHAALTATVAQVHSRILGIVLNHTQPPDPSDLALQTNGTALRRWGRVSHCYQLPYVTPLTPEQLSAQGQTLADQLLAEIGI